MVTSAAPGTKYPFVAVPEEDGSGWTIRFPDLPGAIGFAETWEGVGEEARVVSELWISDLEEDDIPVPAPSLDWDPINRSPDDFHIDAVLTSKEVAELLGVTPRRVNALATTRGVGRIVGGAKVFAPREVAAMRHRIAGRPRLRRTKRETCHV